MLQDREFCKTTAHELSVVADVIADTQELAHQVADDIWLRLCFWRYKGRQTTAGNCAVLSFPGELFPDYHEKSDRVVNRELRTNNGS